MEKKKYSTKKEKAEKKSPKTHLEVEGVKAPLEPGKKYRYKIAQAKILIQAGAAKEA